MWSFEVFAHTIINFQSLAHSTKYRTIWFAIILNKFRKPSLINSVVLVNILSDSEKNFDNSRDAQDI